MDIDCLISAGEHWPEYILMEAIIQANHMETARTHFLGYLNDKKVHLISSWLPSMIVFIMLIKELLLKKRGCLENQSG